LANTKDWRKKKKILSSRLKTIQNLNRSFLNKQTNNAFQKILKVQLPKLEDTLDVEIRDKTAWRSYCSINKRINRIWNTKKSFQFEKHNHPESSCLCQWHCLRRKQKLNLSYPNSYFSSSSSSPLNRDDSVRCVRFWMRLNQIRC
jgi:hypothetical protein